MKIVAERGRSYVVRVADRFKRMLPETGDGIVYGNHEQKFILVLENQSSSYTRAIVKMNGDHVGTWVIAPYQTAYLERPAFTDRAFYFLKKYSRSGMEAGAAEIDPESSGLIEVTFTPEYNNFARPVTGSSGVQAKRLWNESVSYSAKSPAIVGLGEETGQHYGVAKNRIYDNSKSATIYLRLGIKSKRFASTRIPPTLE